MGSGFCGILSPIFEILQISFEVLKLRSGTRCNGFLEFLFVAYLSPSN